MKCWHPVETIIIIAIMTMIATIWAAPFVRFPAEVAKIEEVRIAVNKTTGTEAEDILGQALETNKTIAERRTFNKQKELRRC